MQRAMVPTMIAVVAGTPTEFCPSSPADPHAQTSIEFSALGTTCDHVMQEIMARIQANSDGSWLDPHNGGNYSTKTVLNLNSYKIAVSRDTGSASIAQGGPFRDNLLFTFDNGDDGRNRNCRFRGCSASQVQSVTDFSGGYCNLRNLYCGSDVGCTTLKHDFQFSETHIGLSDGKYIDGVFHEGASADASMCIVPVAAEV